MEISQEDFSNLVGIEDTAKVVRVLEYGAYVQLERVGKRGYLHISQVSSEFTEAPLSRILSVDDTRNVVVVGFDKVHECWQVSCKAYDSLEKFRASGLEPGDMCTGTIGRVTELGCNVHIGAVSAELLAPESPWSNYRVLFESGSLVAGVEIEVQAERWSLRSNKLQLTLPRKPLEYWISAGKCLGRVIFIRPPYIKSNRRRLQSVIYLAINNNLNALARVVLSEIVDVESEFPVDSEVPIEVKAMNVYTGILDADVCWDATRFSTLQVPKIGDCVTATVIRTAPYGAICLISNRVTGFLYKDSVIGKVKESLRDYLAPGDDVEVRVVEKTEGCESDWRVEFVRRLGRFFQNAFTPESALIDLEAVRHVGRSGGFTRDKGFRLNVLEAYGHKCCVCGSQYVVSTASAMEAAHIVPRSYRGSDLVQNALCLCPVHHWAFDKGFLTIDDELCVRVSRLVQEADKTSSWLSELDGRPATLVAHSPISVAALAWHRRNVFVDDLD